MMPRKKTAVPERHKVALPSSTLEHLSDTANQLVIAREDQDECIKALAHAVGYEGGLTAGALEDGIRFYQRRTVEACLELGKRLCVLKEITPHGEFTSRIELLGMTDRTARRFMQAATKTSKSANLAVLAEQVKNQSVFLELITLDDDDLKELAELDDIDRLSPSELRVKVRELKDDSDAKDRVLSKKQADLTKLQLSTNKKIVAMTDWPAAFDPLVDQIDFAMRSIDKAYTDLKECISTAWRVEPEESERGAYEGALYAVGRRVDGCLKAAQQLNDDTTAWFEQTIATADNN